MLPDTDEAMRELKLAEELNPGPWVKHSINVGIAAKKIAERIPSMNPEKAYITGLLHDIGRRVGIVDIPTHVYEGYRYCMEKGWDEAARICMTHSYLRMKDEFCYEPETDREKAIKAYIANCTADLFSLNSTFYKISLDLPAALPAGLPGTVFFHSVPPGL